MHIRASRYFFRLVVFCILLGAVPVLALGVFSYYRSAHMIQQKVNDSNRQVLTQTQMRVEQVLQSVDRSLMYFADSTYVNAAMASRLAPEDFQIAGELTNQLNHLATFDLGVEDASLVNIGKDWILNCNGLYKLSEAENREKYLAYINIPKSSVWMSEMTSLTSSGRIYSDSFFNKPAIDLIKKVPINSLQPLGIAIVKIPCDFLGKLLSNSDTSKRVMILDGDYRLLADNEGSEIGEGLAAEDFVDKIRTLSLQEGNFNIRISNEMMSVTFLKSSYTGWTYVSTIAVSDMTQDTQAIGWFTALLCVGMVLMTGMISIFGSNKMYHPIRSLFESVVGINGAELPAKGRDEFQLIRERVSLLLHNQTKMSSQIYNQLQQLKEFFVLKLIQGEMDKKEIEDKLGLYRYTAAAPWMSLIVVQIDTLEDIEYEEKDRDLMMFAINNIVSELLEKERLLDPIVVNQSQVTVVGGNQETYDAFKSFICTLAEKIKAAVREYLGLQVSMGISRPFHAFQDTHQAYMEGQEALKYQIRFGYSAVLFIEDVQQWQNVQSILPVRLQNELIEAVKMLDREKVELLLRQYLEAVFKMQLSHGDYQIPMARLLTDLIRIMQDAGESYRVLCKSQKSLFEQLFELKTAKSIEGWFMNSIIGPILQILEEKVSKQCDRISGDIIRMIEEEFDTDLTLEKCASRLNYHPSYIRRVFRNKTGMNFSEYLVQYRFSMAKRWLIETDMKISDISERLQYNNAQNFIRSFRKIEGVTPGQYRNGR